MFAELEGVYQPPEVPPTMGGGQSLPPSPPEGHLVIVAGAEMKQTREGTGTALYLDCQIMDGPQSGLHGTWILNLGHANPVTVRIAQEALGCICHAVGHLGALGSTEPIQNKPFRVIVVPQMKDGQPHPDGYVNITKVLRADGSKLTDPPGTGGAAPVAPAPAPVAPPAAVAPPVAAPAPVAQAAPPVAPPVAVAPPAAPAITTAVAPPAAVAPAPVAAPPAAAPPQPGWPAQPAAAAPPVAAAPPAAVAPGGQPWNAAPGQ